MVDRMARPSEPVTIGLVGKYVDLPDAYLSVVEALRARGPRRTVSTLDLRWIASDDLEGMLAAARPRRRRRHRGARRLRGAGDRGQDRRRSATPGSRSIPFLGLCLGLQCAVIEFARSATGPRATPTRASSTRHPAPRHRPDGDPAGRRGHGRHHAARPVRRPRLAEGSHARRLYGEELIYERHRHRYEVNNRYRKDLERRRDACSPGCRRTTTSSRSSSCPTIPYFVASQFHPEFKSRPDDPHPLFAGFIEAADGGIALGLERSPSPTSRRRRRPNLMAAAGAAHHRSDRRVSSLRCGPSGGWPHRPSPPTGATWPVLYADHLGAADPPRLASPPSSPPSTPPAVAATTIARRMAARSAGFTASWWPRASRSATPPCSSTSPRRPRALPKALTVEEIFASSRRPIPPTPAGRRDRALLEFLYATGARVAEAVALDELDLDLEEGTALVTGKGDKQRVGPGRRGRPSTPCGAGSPIGRRCARPRSGRSGLPQPARGPTHPAGGLGDRAHRRRSRAGIAARCRCRPTSSGTARPPTWWRGEQT